MKALPEAINATESRRNLRHIHAPIA